MTAVTTAGLLAGLFGSAFVPVARAATTSAVLACASDTDWDDVNTVSGAKATCTAKASKSVKLSITTAGTGDTVKVVVSGATIDTNVLALDADHDIVQITSTTITLFAAVDGGVTTFAVTSPAAGGTATVKSYWLDSATLGTTITINSVATAAAGVPSVYTSNTTLQTTDFDSLETVAGATDGVAGTTTVNGGVDYIQAEYNSDGTAETVTGFYMVQFDMEDDYAEPINAKNFTIATSCGTVDAGVNAAAADDVSTDAEVIVASDSDGDLFVSVQHPGADKPCLATVTAKYTATGKVIHTFKVGFLGETASLAITAPSALAANLADNADLEDQVKVVAKDALGIAIPSALNLATFVAAGVDAFGNATAPVTTGMTDTTTNGGTADEYYDLTSVLCPANSEGTKVTLSAKGEAKVDLTNAVSTAVTLTCTGKTAYISKVAFDKGRGLASEVLDVLFTLVDEDGRAMGIGGSMAAGNYTIINTCSTTAEPGSLTAFEVGVAEYAWTAATTAAGSCGFTFNVLDNDDGVVAAPAIFTASIFIGPASYGNSISMVARKVTVDFGAGAGSRKVTFTVEFLSGRIRNYVRKANAAGVANFKSPFGRVYVTASFGDEISDTVYLKK